MYKPPLRPPRNPPPQHFMNSATSHPHTPRTDHPGSARRTRWRGVARSCTAILRSTPPPPSPLHPLRQISVILPQGTHPPLPTTQAPSQPTQRWAPRPPPPGKPAAARRATRHHPTPAARTRSRARPTGQRRPAAPTNPTPFPPSPPHSPDCSTGEQHRTRRQAPAPAQQPPKKKPSPRRRRRA